ncbi:ead/Ea22-like family protein [Klebsiella aerogenes]|uniref:ead/Ea22-like family protein n=1 Tax=Klebsiella aerogenes TaxID=548 RepID=UPI00351D0F0D
MTDITNLTHSLKAAAEKAGIEKWQVKRNGPGEYGVMVKGSLVKRSGWSTHRPVADEVVDKNTADFIAQANPANILTLVEAFEKAQAENTAGAAGMAESYETTISMLKTRIAELEESHAQVIQSRDHYKRMSEEGLKQLAESRTAMNEVTEIDPRDAFEKIFPIPIFCIRCGDGYASTSFNGWDANTHKARWEGWKAASGVIKSRTVTVQLPQRHSMLLREDFNEDYHTEMAYKADEVQASLTAQGIKLEAE